MPSRPTASFRSWLVPAMAILWLALAVPTLAGVPTTAPSDASLAPAHAALAAADADFNSNQIARALTEYQNAVDLYEQVYAGADDPDLATAISRVGQCCYMLREYDDALKAAQDSLAMRQRLYPNQDDASIATGQVNVAYCLQALGRDADALPLYQAALKMRQRLHHHQDDPEVAQTFDLVGYCLHDLDRNADALPMHQAALDMWRRISNGQDSPEVATSLFNVASCLGLLNRNSEALPLFQDALAMRKRLNKGQDNPDTAQSMASLAVCLGALGRDSDALPFYQDALEMRKRLYNNRDCPEIAQSLDDLGFCFGSLHRYADELPVRQQAADMWRRIYPNQDRAEIAADLNDVGFCLHSLDRDIDALPANQAALDMWRRIHHNQDSPDIAQALNALGYCLHALDRNAEALALHQQALDMLQRLYKDQDRPDVAETLTAVGWCLGYVGRPADALPIYKSALAMRQRLNKNQDNPDTASSLNDVAYALQELGRGDEAQPIYQAALDMRRKIYKNQDHPDIAQSLNNLADCLASLGRDTEALALFQAALDMRRRLSKNQDTPDLAQSLDNLANCLGGLGQNAQALPMHQEVVAMWQRIYRGRDHRNVAQGLTNLAACLSAMGRSGQALSLYQQALDMRLRLFDNKDHPEIASSLSSVASCLQALNRNAQALPMYQAALDMRRRIYKGLDHPDVADSLNDVGLCLEALGSRAEALTYYQSALDMRRRIYKGKDHPAIASSLNNLAYCLQWLGRPKEALPLFQSALDMWRRVYHDQDHPDIAMGLNNVAACLEALNRRKDALPLYQQSVAMSQRLQVPDLFRCACDLGGLELDLGDPAAAANAYSISVDSLEQVRESVGGDDQDKMDFIAAARAWDPYSGMIRAQIELAHPDKALEFLDRGRARRLLDILERAVHGSDSDILGPLEEKAKLTGDSDELNRIAAARSALHAADDQVRFLTAEINRARSLNNQDGLNQINDLKGKLDLAYQQYANARRDEFNLAGRTTAAQQSTSLDIQSLLRPHQHLLLYSIDRGNAVLLVVPPSGQPVAGDYLTQSDGDTRIPAGQLVDLIHRYRSAVIQHGMDSVRGVRPRPSTAPTGSMTQEGFQLFQELMPPAVWDQIKNDDLVYVVPDPAMSGLPLEMLITDPPPSSNAKDCAYWMDGGPPLCYEPSAGALLELRRQEPDRSQKTWRHQAVLLGDPVLQRDAGDSKQVPRPQVGALITQITPGSPAEAIGLRKGAIITAYGGIDITGKDDFAQVADKLALMTLHGKLATIPKLKFWLEGQIVQADFPVDAAERDPGMQLADVTSIQLAMRNATLTRYGALSPLPGTRDEVSGIYHVLTGTPYAGQPDDSVVVLLGEDATNQRLKDAAGGTRYLHLATHGLVQPGDDAIYSSLVLTQPKVVTPENTGMLSLQDLFDHWWGKLDGTELVVLSACDSQGLDENNINASASEGVFGLPWGFMYAGSPAVVASLWEVEDASTAKLMQEFYGDMHAQDHDDKLAAFAAARKQLKKDYPEPFFWAPFIYLGDPN